MSTDLHTLVVDAGFTSFSVKATAIYVPPAGESVPCKIIIDRRSRRMDAGDSNLTRGGVIIDVRALDVPQPVVGGLFIVSGVNHKIISQPEALDSDRLIWRCSCRI